MKQQEQKCPCCDEEYLILEAQLIYDEDADFWNEVSVLRCPNCNYEEDFS